MTRRTIEAPAKINLGLEILGRRPDGYHEIRTVMCTISLCDTISFEPTGADADEFDFKPATSYVPTESNLVARTLQAMRRAGVGIPPQRVTIRKRIPAAAGLGGASSDAAATLLIFEEEIGSNGADIDALAAGLGSDVPFFLHSPAALASGRGEILQPLPPPDPDRWIVLATPRLAIENKTSGMYAAVDPAWWSSGARVEAVASALPSLPSKAPFNVFERALLRMYPQLEKVPRAMVDAGVAFAALTGAGPTFYGLVPGEEDAREIAERIRTAGIEVNVARVGWKR